MSDEILAMSDEDFLKLNEPPVVSEGSSQIQETQQTDEERAAAEAAAQAATQAAAEEEARKAEALAAEEAAQAAAKETSNGGTVASEEGEQTDKTQASAVTDPPADQSGKDGQDAGAKKVEEDSSLGSKTEGQDGPPDYEALYKELLQPIKANGKMLDLKSPQEIRQLAQMGADYTRKMQALAPHRKMLLMLQNNGLLDEDKLSFLIDIEKRNPEAIKKLLKDAGIDPLEIDTGSEPTYRGGNHRVSDEEANFATALEDLQSSQGGSDTLSVINTKWDQASKEVLWSSPEILQVIHEQRASGVYDRVAAEVDRQKTLGQIATRVPFLQAYKAVGDQMASAGKLDDLVKVKPPVTQVSTPVVVRAATPKPVVKNGDKASAAAATRSTPKTAEVKINPLALSDEDFLKQTAPRP